MKPISTLLLLLCLTPMLLLTMGCKDNNGDSKTEGVESTATSTSTAPTTKKSADSVFFAPPTDMVNGQTADISLVISDLPYKRLFYAFRSADLDPQILPRAGVLEIPSNDSARLLAAITATTVGIHGYQLEITTEEGQTLAFDFTVNVAKR